jgi:hypothetical protein
LYDLRGRTYRPGAAAGFHIYFQPAEGKLWSRLYRDGVPLRLLPLISKYDFWAEVGNAHGSYQLQPVDADGREMGDPPAMLRWPIEPETKPASAPAPVLADPPTSELTDEDIEDRGE